MSDGTKSRTALTDAELLARYRHKHGHPYMTASMAKKMRRLEVKYAHLDVAAAKARDKDRQDAERLLRTKVFPANVADL